MPAPACHTVGWKHNGSGTGTERHRLPSAVRQARKFSTCHSIAGSVALKGADQGKQARAHPKEFPRGASQSNVQATPQVARMVWASGDLLSCPPVIRCRTRTLVLKPELKPAVHSLRASPYNVLLTQPMVSPDHLDPKTEAGASCLRPLALGKKPSTNKHQAVCCFGALSVDLYHAAYL